MNHNSNFSSDWYVRQELRELRKNLESHRKVAKIHNDAQRERLNEHEVMEHNFGRLLLIVQTLLELGVRKGAFTNEEFIQVLHECDLQDGKADGLAAPSSELGMKPKPSPAPTVLGFLRQLEKQPVPTSTNEFLGQLEKQDELSEQ